MNPLTPEIIFLEQANSISGNERMKLTKRSMLYLFLLFVLLTIIAAETSVMLSVVKGIDLKEIDRNCTFSDKNCGVNKSIDGVSTPLNHTFQNCVYQYKIGSGIRVSSCVNEQHGKIIDIRLFLKNKATLKGIAIPHIYLPRLVQALSFFQKYH